jgi:hypothetical protein
MGLYPPDEQTDHLLEMSWNAPATMYLKIGAMPVGARGHQRETGPHFDAGRRRKHTLLLG